MFGAVSRIGSSVPAGQPEPVSSAKSPLTGTETVNFATRAAAVTEDRCESRDKPSRNRVDGKRCSLLFGENAPKVELPVRKCIERRAVPKRCRESVNVDTLSAMMVQLWNDGKTKKVKALETNDDDLSRTFGDMRVRKRTGERPSKGKVTKVAKIPKVEGGSSCEEAKRVSKGDEVPRAEDDDTADELSFLVDRCDLDSEKRQATFMPYIT